jgi:predicted nucleotidyltransferase component of viral defense system
VGAKNMITKEELRRYAAIKKLNLGQAEKEYFQNLILFMIYEVYGKELVFKGGTALNRAHGLPRFSEDLDFTEAKELNNEAIKNCLKKGFEKFYLEGEIIEKKSPMSINYILRIKGPLYIGVRQSLCKLQIDISMREKVLKEPQLITMGRFMQEVPQFDVPVMAPEEMCAEKVRAILTRMQARDVYDLWFLIQGKTKIDMQLIEEKLKYNKKTYDAQEFKKNLAMKEAIWTQELTPLMQNVPLFDEARKSILEAIEAR